MEKYYKASEVQSILNKLAKEPAYYHEGEDFYNGVCAVEGELMCLKAVELEEHKVGRWLPYTEYYADDYSECNTRKVFTCSRCGRLEKNKEPYCNCGAKMTEE